eukprot:1143079-Rhodomonas_salina.1
MISSLPSLRPLLTARMPLPGEGGRESRRRERREETGHKGWRARGRGGGGKGARERGREGERESQGCRRDTGAVGESVSPPLCMAHASHYVSMPGADLPVPLSMY